VLDSEPGLRRVRAGAGLHYVAPNGRAVRDARTLERIRSLSIPPAYEDVWICRDPRGHVQATGRDARGRKQYRYHPRWRARDEVEVRPDARLQPGIARDSIPRPARPPRREFAEKVIAAIVQLLEDTCIRVGNEEYARANRSYGLTTPARITSRSTATTSDSSSRGSAARSTAPAPRSCARA
jgi:DNA topoisomerase-1